MYRLAFPASNSANSEIRRADWCCAAHLHDDMTHNARYEAAHLSDKNPIIIFMGHGHAKM